MFRYMWRKDLALPFDKYTKIDSHAHIQELAYPFNVGIGVDDLVRIMDAYRIEITVVCDVNNEAILNAVRRYPQRFIGAVWVDPREENAETTIRHYIEDLGFKGIKLHPLLHMFSLSSKASKRILGVAGELGVPVFIHTGHPPTSLPWQVEDLAREYPDVQIVMIHMGHGNAFYIQGSIEIAARRENVYLETSGMPMSSKIAEAYEVVPDKVLFGTDIPCHHPAVEITKVIASGLPESALRKIFYDNARRLLNI